MPNLGTSSSVHTVLNPAFDAFYTFQNQHCKERKPKWCQEERGNQSGDAAGSSVVDDDADRIQCGSDGNETQHNSGYFHNLCSDLDENNLTQAFSFRNELYNFFKFDKPKGLRH